jgi:CRP-like cAMP-binding protein
MDAAHPLTHHVLFHSLPDEEMDQLVPFLVRRTFAPGEVLFVRGDPPGDVFFLTAGIVKVYLVSGRDEQLLAYVMPGESLGEMSAMDGLPRSANAMAMAEAEAYCVSAETFRRFVHSAPVASSRLLHQLSRRLRRMDENAVDILFTTRRALPRD